MAQQRTLRTTSERRRTHPQHGVIGEPERSGAHRLVTAMRRASVALDAGRAAAQARLEISRGQLAALELLSATSPLVVGHIAAEIGVSTGAASEMVERLVAQDLVARVDDPADRRRTLVSITPSGWRQFRRAYTERWRWVHAMASELSSRDVDVVSDFLERLHDAMPRDWRELAPAPPPEIHIGQADRQPTTVTRTRSAHRQSTATRGTK